MSMFRLTSAVHQWVHMNCLMLNAKNTVRINSKLWVITLGSGKDMDISLPKPLLVVKDWHIKSGHYLYFCCPADFTACCLSDSSAEFLSSAHFHRWQWLKCIKLLCCCCSKGKRIEFSLPLLHFSYGLSWDKKPEFTIDAEVDWMRPYRRRERISYKICHFTCWHVKHK